MGELLGALVQLHKVVGVHDVAQAVEVEHPALISRPEQVVEATVGIQNPARGEFENVQQIERRVGDLARLHLGVEQRLGAFYDLRDIAKDGREEVHGSIVRLVAQNHLRARRLLPVAIEDGAFALPHPVLRGVRKAGVLDEPSRPVRECGFQQSPVEGRVVGKSKEAPPRVVEKRGLAVAGERDHDVGRGVADGEEDAQGVVRRVAPLVPVRPSTHPFSYRPEPRALRRAKLPVCPQAAVRSRPPTNLAPFVAGRPRILKGFHTVAQGWAAPAGLPWVWGWDPAKPGGVAHALVWPLLSRAGFPGARGPQPTPNSGGASRTTWYTRPVRPGSSADRATAF